MKERFTITTSMQALWTPFVMHNVISGGDEFNDDVYRIASEYDDVIRKERSGCPSKKDNNLGYGGMDLIEYAGDRQPIKDLLAIVKEAAVTFIESVYGYRHSGEIVANAGTFWQKNDQNLGIPTHTHHKHDLVAVYYPKIVGDSDSPLSDGSLRLYDPSNIGKRFWDCANEHSYYGNWYAVKPQAGSLVLFEGWIPHDSGYFAGEERLSIPFLLDICTDRKHKMTKI